MSIKAGVERSALTTLSAAASQAAAAPTKTEFDALVAKFNELRAVILAAGLAK